MEVLAVIAGSRMEVASMGVMGDKDKDKPKKNGTTPKPLTDPANNSHLKPKK